MRIELTGLEMSAHLMSAWSSMSLSRSTCALSARSPSSAPSCARSPIERRLTMNEKCMAMSVERMMPWRTFLKSAVCTRERACDANVGVVGEGRLDVVGEAAEGAGEGELDDDEDGRKASLVRGCSSGPRRKPSPCLRRSETVRMQCMFSSADMLL